MRAARLALACLALALPACYEPLPEGEEIARYPVRDLEGVLTGPGELVIFDPNTTWDGNGALRMYAQEDSRVRLYRVDSVDVEDAILVYQARLRTRGLEGRAFLEMLAEFGDEDVYFSRAERRAVRGDTDWTMQQTPFRLQPGESPERVHLNLMIEGTGEVWVDDVRLLRFPSSYGQ